MSDSKPVRILESGTQLGPYYVVSLIGEGGMGSVYKAFDSVLNRHVALKVILPDQNCDDVMIMRFICEGQALARLNHQNVVTAYALGEEKGQHYIAMEYVEGDPLDKYAREKIISYPEIIEIFRQMLEGVKALHNRGIIHRDLKPKNIIVCKDKTIKIVDFGIAKFSHQQNMELTSVGMVIGSIPYLSPELAAGETAKFQSDIWSLGVIVYELINGKRPFIADNQLALIEKIKHQDLEFPSRTIDEAPKGLLKIVTKMCQKKTHQRYLCVEDILKDLQQINIERDLPASQRIPVDGTLPSVGHRDTSKRTRTVTVESGFHFSGRSLIAFGMTFLLILGALFFSRRYLKQEQVISEVPPLITPVVEVSTTTSTTVKVVATLPPSTLPPPVVRKEIVEKPQPPATIKMSVDVTPAKPTFYRPQKTVKIKKEHMAPVKVVKRKTEPPKKIAKAPPERKAKPIAKPLIVKTAPAPVEVPVRTPSSVANVPSVPLEKPLAILPTPKMKLPPKGVAIVSMGESQDPIMFKWEKIENASNYALQLSTQEDFSEIIFKTQSKSNQVIVTSALPKGRVFWRVRALGEQAASEWTAPSFFDLSH